MIRQLGLCMALVVGMLGCTAASESSIVILNPSPTASPSATVSPLQTLTPLATITLAPTSSPEATANNPLAPTHTPAPTTQAAANALPLGFSIEYFISNAQGEGLTTPAITLFWRVSGAQTVQIFRLSEGGARLQAWTVEAQGRLRYQLDPTQAPGTDFVLVATAADGKILERELDASADLGQTCAVPWFFAPPPQICAEGPPTPLNMVEQRFERGRMLWQGESRTIYVLFDTGDWLSFPDTYTDDQPANDPNLAPPSGLIQPSRGFGLVWRRESGLQERLGWAIEGENGFETIFQTGLGGNGVYVRAREGGILALETGAWRLLAETPPE